MGYNQYTIYNYHQLPQFFGVLTEACLASSHSFRTSSQCVATQAQEPVKLGKGGHWNQARLANILDMCLNDFKTASKNPISNSYSMKKRWHTLQNDFTS